MCVFSILLDTLGCPRRLKNKVINKSRTGIIFSSKNAHRRKFPYPHLECTMIHHSATHMSVFLSPECWYPNPCSTRTRYLLDSYIAECYHSAPVSSPRGICIARGISAIHLHTNLEAFKAFLVLMTVLFACLKFTMHCSCGCIVRACAVLRENSNAVESNSKFK